MKQFLNPEAAGMAGGKSSLTRRLMTVAIPLVISVGLCWVLFRSVDFGEMMELIRTGCHFKWILLSLGLSIVPMLLRAVRWGLQLRAMGLNPSPFTLILSIFGMYAVNLVFPRLGEIWRTGYVAYNQRAPFSGVFGSMVADRMADLLMAFAIAFATLFIAEPQIEAFVSTYPDAYAAIARFATSPLTWLLAAAALGGCWWLLAHSRNRFIAKIRQFLKGLWDGFASIARMKGKMQWLGLTIGIWGCYFIQLVVAFNAFDTLGDMLHRCGLLVPLVCFVLTSISMGIPSHGGIGVYQTVMLFALTLFLSSVTVPREEFTLTAIAFGNVVIASQTVLLILLGLFTFAAIGIRGHLAQRKNMEK